VALLLLVGALAVVGGVLAPRPSRAEELRVAQAAGPASPELLARGRALFSDVGLSADGKWSCASCHPSEGHTDNKTYVGVTVVVDGDPAGRSTPTLWGAGFRRAYSWAGTAPSLEANIRGIIVNRMKGPEPSPETLAALAAYVRSLPHPPNPNLREDGSPSDVAPAAARRGYELFLVKAGCKTCHEPPHYEKKDTEDVGSGGAFKVPSLRSVSRTGPYFHDGRYRTLEQAVRAMWEYVQKAGTSETLTDDDIRDLVEFLKVL
jgi:cytochrome c peroxidase